MRPSLPEFQSSDHRERPEPVAEFTPLPVGSRGGDPVRLHSGWGSASHVPLWFRVAHLKGNIGGDCDRVYHAPGGQYYDRTQIDTSRGERWFCSESEARAAGWRRSKR